MTVVAPGQVSNLADLVAAAALRVPSRPALIDGVSGDTLTWSRVDAAVSAYAERLRAAAVGPGERVVIRLPIGIPYCLAVFGVLRVGAVVVPTSVDLPTQVLEHMVTDSGASAVIGDAPPGIALTRLPVPAPAPVTPAEVVSVGGGEDLAVLCYTSGTSGLVRGAMLSHRALLANAEQCAALRPAPVTETDRVLVAVPLSHAYGLGPGLFQVASAGAALVLLPRFRVRQTLETIECHRVTTLIGVPSMYSALLTTPTHRLREAMASVRLLTSGAAPLGPELLSAVRRATGLPVFEGYGMTETGPVLTSTLVSGKAKPGSVGRPLPGVQIRLLDTDGRALPGPEAFDDLLGDERAGTGRVSVRGANLFSGYWPDGARGPDAEGWFDTGDIGYLDTDGDLHLVDRANDLIIVNGFAVYPREIERVLEELPDVVEAAAVGVPDARAGETVKAVLVRTPGSELTVQAVLDYCTDRLARFKMPTVVEFAESLPRSTTGELVRRRLRAG